MGLNSVEIDPENENAILLSLSKDVTRGDYISVSYFPGSLAAIDGSKADAFGPEAISNPESPVAVNVFNERTLRVFPNPATSILNIEYDKAPYQVSLYNSLGVLVHNDFSWSESLILDVSKYKEGMYLLKIQDSENSIKTIKVILK